MEKRDSSVGRDGSGIKLSRLFGGQAPPPAATPGGISTGSILRRRKEHSTPLGAAAKALSTVMDLSRKVTIDSVAAVTDALDRGKKPSQLQAHSSAPPEVTKAFSAALSHIVAPLWSAAARPLPKQARLDLSSPKCLTFARTLDDSGAALDSLAPHLEGDTELATLYLLLLVARLSALEGGEAGTPFTGLLLALAQQSATDPAEEYEEHANDEVIAHDQPRRRLTEVGGSWKPRGAVELPAQGHALRVQLLLSALRASVCFRYNYNDPTLQAACDALASQLFLLSYSETLVALVAGVKGPQYVAKYFWHLARPVLPECDEAGEILGPEAPSLLLEHTTGVVQLAVDNFVHRNDTGDVTLAALSRALQLAAPEELRSVLQLVREALRVSYCADIAALLQLLGVVRPLALRPAPTGSDALAVGDMIWAAIRCHGAPQREFLSTLFVAGKELRSFRRRPAHVLVCPQAARAFIVEHILTAKVPMQRGASDTWPALVSDADHLGDVAHGGPVDDTVLYLANHMANVLQAAHELCSASDAELVAEASGPADGDGAEARAAKAAAVATLQAMDLGALFATLPQTLCAAFYDTYRYFESGPHRPVLSDPLRTDHATLGMLAEQYLAVTDAHHPVRAAKRVRRESPRPPVRPLLQVSPAEEDGMAGALRAAFDQHWRYCDRRILDGEPERLHPRSEIALSHFIERDIDLLVVGGTGSVRAVCEAMLRLRAQYPGAVPPLRLFLLPAGYDNDIAAWLARVDPLYLQRIVAPLACIPTSTDQPRLLETLTQSPPATQPSLALRQAVNHFLCHATAENHVVLYEVECTARDGRTFFVVMSSNFELGGHIIAAADAVGVASTYEGLRTESFCLRGAPAARHVDPMETHAPMPSPVQRQEAALKFVEEHTSLEMLAVGTELVSVDRVLVRMHGERGMELATRRHPGEGGGDVPACATGTDVLDWVSTTFHLYDATAPHKAAQAMLDAGLILCTAVPHGRTADRFVETALYRPREREEPDTMPLCVPAARSRCFDTAQSVRAVLEESQARPPPQFALRARVVFEPRPVDTRYGELCYDNAVKAPVRELATLKVKSTGSTGDAGGHVAPTDPTLQLSWHDLTGRIPGATLAAGVRPNLGDSGLGPGAGLRGEHFHLTFGDRAAVDPNCVLAIDIPEDAPPGGAPRPHGVHCAVDGEVLGPFVSFRIRPITAADGRPVTVPFMSFLQAL